MFSPEQKKQIVPGIYFKEIRPGKNPGKFFNQCM
jgi:hypothetical protein